MKHKDTPAHIKWHRRVEGQIRDCMHHHPELFNTALDMHQKNTLVNSLAKRIVGEIIAAGRRTSGPELDDTGGDDKEVVG